MKKNQTDFLRAFDQIFGSCSSVAENKNICRFLQRSFKLLRGDLFIGVRKFAPYTVSVTAS